MARNDDEESRAGRAAAHVGRASHGKGGGHAAPGQSRAAVAGANAARGVRGQPTNRASFVARQAANAGSWETASVLVEQDDDDMTHPLYQGMKFKDYEFQEYPKMVYLDSPDGTRERATDISLVKQVEDEDEEATVLAGRAVVRESEERPRLIKVAEVKGVVIDKRWGLDKMRDAIIKAGFDPELDPFS